MGKQAIIIGAGPAGLTAAYELLKRTDIKPIILEKSGDIGGISKTIKYKGNRMDIGGHRFFSKSDRVMNWWLNIMPLEKTSEESVTINYHNKTRSIATNTNSTGEPTNPGLVMLLRKRLSRIYFLRKFFNYPIQLSIDTLRKLGLIRTIRILLSYLFAQLVPRKPEKSLEDFLINRFGRELYLLFFKDYTEKVWGVPCNEISAEWGAQRIKGVSISKAIQHAAQMMMKKKKKASGDISQKDTETSLIEQFLYPALGPGQLWEEVARQIQVLGGTILMHQNVKSIELEGDQVKSITAVNSQTGEETVLEGDYFFSTMPVQELIAGMKGSVPTDVKEIAAGLQYRDFITVGILLEKLSTAENQTLDLKDTWIYIQERDVKVGRLQLFNNWSPYMVNKPGTVWIGMEYFCNEGDDFWRLTDEEIKRTAVAELEKMGLAQVQHVLDSTVHRVEKTYPAYFGTYNQFDKIRAFTDQFANLFLVGRNGMHKYNNADHSMLTAMVSVDNIATGITSKENIWAINTEQEYHEQKSTHAKQYLAADTNISKQPVTPYSGQPISFKEFLFSDKLNKAIILMALICMTILFSIFKYFYPYPSFIHSDSFLYLQGAHRNLDINIYPVGYSNFIRLISVFTTSDTALVFLQYFLLQCSGLVFLFTIFYFLNVGKIVQCLLLGFFVFNPLSLYLSNIVSSDSLFASLSFMWASTLIWIVNKPNVNIIIAQALILFYVFTVRYNAMFYPIITAIAFILSGQRLKRKLLGISFGILLIVIFIAFNNYKYYKIANAKIFTPFSGWQLANNALYTYRYVDPSNRKQVPVKFSEIDKMVRSYFDSLDFRRNPWEAEKASTMYMWAARSPLRQYMKQKFKIDSGLNDINRWSKVAPLFKDYGFYLITQYPKEYFQYYVYPNMTKFNTPPLEFLETYNMGRDSVQEIAKVWFRYKSTKIKSAFDDFDINVLQFFPIMSGIVNVIFLVSVVCFCMFPTNTLRGSLKKTVILFVCFWLFNFGFSVLAAPISLRFQAFPIMACLAFTLILVEFVVNKAFSEREEFDLRNQQHNSSFITEVSYK